MDRGTLIGLLLGLALLVTAISIGPNPRIFLHPESLVVVLGGVIASTMIRFPLSNVRSAFAVASRAFLTHTRTSREIVNELVGLSQRARREGVLGLEKHLPSDAFMAQGIRMVVDRVSRDHIHDVLAQEIQTTFERHTLGQEIFRFIASAAPSFGMVGTLIGMVHLFVSLKDPSGIGHGMALSLLSTLYGAVIAYLIALPISGKLELRSREELQTRRLMLEGILGIRDEMNPGQLEEALNAFLAPEFRTRRAGGSNG
ncbi:motility protein A [Mesoterricola sediminis]|uniref:Flagellar motor protein MotP n=1 Tax=Mesoterricola sediminis TaxID=2927980 RepID=A0AA48H9L0_9BACT|nr:MotA/TolQ/ExbB proton channel family protein [Mesoterricola sediminis]BDU78433.1 flagellar motor protein MotP [Mesoterricola sediminis]